MSLDPTAREANVKDSIRKYFIDNVHRGEGIHVMFDRTLSAPKTTGQRQVDEWLTVNFGFMDLTTLSEINLDLYVCTRKDPEGWKLAQLRDKVVNYLIDTTQTDSMARISFYKTYPEDPWILLGAFIVQDFGPESPQMVADDETKFKLIPVRLRWGAKV